MLTILPENIHPDPWDLYDETYAGLDVAVFPPDDDDEELPAAGAVAWRIAEPDAYDAEEGAFAGTLQVFLDQVATEEVRALVIGCWEQAYDTDSSAIVNLLAENAKRFPALRAIFLGAIQSEEAEISWIQQSDVTALLTAFPQLERLEVRGGTGLALSPVRHENLRVLRFETGGLPAEVVRAVAASDLPALEHLDLWLGIDNYGGDSTVADLAPILAGDRLPALKHLGLQDSDHQDEIAAAVAAAPIVARLDVLSLAMGTLGDEGAEALLSGQPLSHLKVLDLRHNYVTDPLAERLRVFVGDAELDLAERKERDDWIYVSVAE
ncbi:leucine-rich repeat domain-containing protein [Herbidospora galbida]|uniref:Leucine-rich repeat domain-containing protein n=1 Tax=Herbidospora galbida TaxID=2575442 RepID=A0A4V5UZN1_9ACTN|nr:STM4015 family protein [Herbidospora galbida]TKK89343.1 leucine-rich repeat domain-containing protein [Herbidospora galbida]